MGHRLSTVKSLLLLGMLSLLSLSLFARGEPSEDQVKAAFVYNFAKFVEWPDNAFDNKETPLNLCVIGKDRVGAALQLLEQREAQGRQLHVTALLASKDTLKGSRCHILFIASSEAARQQEILEQFLDAPVLTVADNLDFVKQGGMISLYVEEQRVQFAINQSATHNNGLKLSARMLQLARVPR
ncbi:YfiR family protein [Agitococcus lubricus]|uniref:Uncharacterized protein DUF4154 n=1 Tax=Agitococcus lubricus TaxID=1077255 RepID=A0A2T5J2P6_9GAMM|nr:YfiR family protein [Agitococcus lubricus]PTQ90800.1 uncharacterized protein DUF4154 [Agitococcus lubricus]